MRIFEDRAHAGRLLAEELLSRGIGAATPAAAAPRSDIPGAARNTVVLANPRGAVVIAAEVAAALGADLDVIVVRKVGAPGNPEFAIAAVDADGVSVGDPERWADRSYIDAETARQRDEIGRRQVAYRGDRPPLDVRGRTAIVVDDGIATGLTALAAIGWLKRHGAERVVLAVPVATTSSLPRMYAAADDVVVLEAPPGLMAVGQAYAHFPQVEDPEVLRLLAEANR